MLQTKTTYSRNYTVSVLCVIFSVEMMLGGRARGQAAIGFGSIRIFTHAQLIWSTGFVILLFAGEVLGGASWSEWFSITAVAGPDNLTQWDQLIQMTCPINDILDVECRAVNLTMSAVATAASCNLTAACTDTLKELPILLLCPGVEVRVKCPIEDTTDSQSSSDQPLKVNGGFIAMAAGLSVIVPLICVLIIQLRRSKREERERAAAAAAAAAAESGQQPADDPPPSYEQLFGPTVNPVSDGPLHSRQSSLDILIEADETRRPGNPGGDMEISSQTASPSLDSGQRSGEEGGYINHGYSSTSVSTISGSEVFDYPLSSRFTSRGHRESSSIELNQLSSIDSVDGSSSSTEGFSVSTSLEDMSSMTSGHSSLSSGQSSLTSAQSSSPSTSLLSLASTSTVNIEAPPPHPQALLTQPPPPPYTSPATIRSTRSTTLGQSSIQNMLRRLPGMHISIQDILASIRPQQDNTVNELPPPSYEEALKILQCAKLSSQHILGKID